MAEMLESGRIFLVTRWFQAAAMVLLLSLIAIAQDNSTLPDSPTPQPPQNPPAAQPPPQPGDDEQPDDQASQQQKKGIKEKLKGLKPDCVHVVNSPCYDVPHSKDAKKNAPADQSGDSEANAENAPRSDTSNESSSKSGNVDLSPPANDSQHPGADLPEFNEFHSYDPHKADHAVEVGDYYFKRENYHAAESRYMEALQWKSNHAIATYRLAQTEEKLKKPDDARKYYQAYLKILPHGPLAADAKKAIIRLNTRNISETN